MPVFARRFLSLILWTVIVSQIMPQASAQEESEPVRQSTRSRRVLYNFDGDSCLSTKAGSKGPVPVNIDDVKRLIEEVAYEGSRVDTVLVCINAQVMYYPTKVGTMRGTLSTPEERAKWSESENQWFKNLKTFFDAGVDPSAVMLAEAKRRGCEALLTFRMNDDHGVDALRTKFLVNHADWRLGTKQYQGSGAMDFGRDEVRDYTFRLIEEAVGRYDCDGIELDFNRFPRFFKDGSTDERVAKMNSLVERVRKMLDEVGRKRGRRLVLSVRPPSNFGRTPPTPETARKLGCDVPAWARHGWIDFVAVSEFLFERGDLPIDKWKQAITTVPVYGGIECTKGGGAKNLTADEYRQAATQLVKAGADGVYLFNFFTSREGGKAAYEPPFEVLRDLAVMKDGDQTASSRPDGWKPQSADLSVEVRVSPRVQKGRISPYIFGAGIDHKTNPLRAPKYPEKVLKDIAESGLRIARYPGGFVFNRNDHRGSWANFYWQDHIGKNPKRLPTEVYDLDTFLQLCERFGIEPLMQINFVGESQESVQGYIEYLVGDGDIDHDGVNWAEKRKANGRIKPYRITYWQLGNEVHSASQGFQENAAGAKEYARALDRLVPVIRKMSPGAKVLVPFITIQRPRSEAKLKLGDPDINFTTSHEFAVAFLEHLSVKVDYFDWHFYAANGWNGKYEYLDTDDEWKHLYCWGTKFLECHEVINKLIREKCKQQPPPKLIVGEWSGDWTGGIFRQHEDSFRGSLMRTMATGVFMADQLMYMTNKSVPSENIHAAFWHSFSNDAQAMFSVQTNREQGLAYKGKSTDDGYGYRMPIYWVFKLLSEQRGEFLVESHLQGDNTVAAPQPGLYRDPEYTFARISHCASASHVESGRGNNVYLTLLNKDARQTVEVQINIEDWPLKSSVETHEVRADSYLAENTIKSPNTVTLAGPKVDRVEDSGRMTYQLKPNTLAVLRFQSNERRRD